MTRPLKIPVFSFRHTTTAALFLMMTMSAGCGEVRQANEDAGDGQLIDAAAPDAALVDSGLVDASVVDAAVDPYDVVYGIDWEIVEGDYSNSPAVFDGWFVLVNTESIGMPLSTLRVVQVEDDHPTASVIVSANPISETLPAGKAIGMLRPLAEILVEDKALLPEPFEVMGGGQPNLMSMRMFAPAGLYEFSVTVVIELNGVRKTLDINIKRTPLPFTQFQPVLFDRR